MKENQTANNTGNQINNRVTYAEISDTYINNLRQKNVSKDVIKNTRSAIHSWQNAFRISDADFVGSEFDLNFKQNITLYIQKQTKIPVKKSTYIPRVSRIKSFQNFYQNQLKTCPIPVMFGDALEFLLISKGFSPRTFAKDYLTNEIHIKTFLKWRKNKHLPARLSFPVINKIEQIIDVPEGTLFNVLPACLRNQPYRKRRTNFPTKTEKNTNNYLKWTDKINHEWNGLVAYKTSFFRPENTEERNTKRWTRSTSSNPEEIYFPTADVCKSFLKPFFGFCVLNKENPDPRWRGLGMKECNLTLALLTDKGAIEKYVRNFKYARGGNKFNGGALTFLNFVSALLRPDTGYIYQNHHLSKNLAKKLTKKEWKARCSDTHKRLSKISEDIKYLKKTGSCEFGFGRDPKKRISEILELKNPLLVTLQMIKDMIIDIEKLQMCPIEQASLYRDILLISMIQANPFRLKMFRNMQLNKNLIQKQDGSWWIFFYREDFKNRHYLTEDYEVQLSSNIWAIIERYLQTYRPILLGKRITNEVFIAVGEKNKNKHNPGDHRLSIANFWKIISSRAKQYIPNSQGFGMHSFRHLITTSLLKKMNSEKGFELAAKVLHDSPETVKRAYAHLKINEMFDPYNDIFAEIWKEAGLNDSIQNDFSNKEKE